MSMLLLFPDQQSMSAVRFNKIGGQPRYNIAAVDTVTGVVKEWNPNANNIVYALTASAPTVFAGGDFTSINGKVRNIIASLNATTGRVTDWSRMLMA